ncbi:MAG: carboxymuconolactone decarboxylase family protein [Acidimicrobiia bacterium]|nr:carboxymuconolactone decarboxylase family protein [bacterium]MXW59894.1 carboxymuconolactone decarboxylase family protein [Acidimicrobiia bacterium]MDE0613218.1 carboxymuconolactone decarboxylase family protein [bacterium]MXZ84976.1 carboxymuconolactone decarboxylase family protein [Acidimicrobiia bacterium]MYB74540.1 carboxymuconolactone decarboxylase family protein [Acidimicrobiia bacterium]
MSSSADNIDNPASQPRIAPLELSEWTPEGFAAMEPMRPPAGSAYDKRKADRKQQVRRPNNALSVMARYPELAQAFLAFNRHLLYFNTLPGRAIELAVLRVAWLRRSEYEWVQHAAAALEVGLTAEEIDRTTADSVDGWNPDDALLLRAVDELHHNHGWSGGTWNELADAFDTRQIMDLLFTVGAYDTLAVAFNCFDLPLDPELEGKSFPSGAEG